VKREAQEAHGAFLVMREALKRKKDFIPFHLRDTNDERRGTRRNASVSM
jgi:hypothetical protein